MVPHVESNNCIGAPVIGERTKTCTVVLIKMTRRSELKVCFA